ncbi:MAG: MFS transporter [Nocardioides sp.]|uniref:MFS transporter n=1 Tax=Nocardioides sp. TaxID=35761 RepID=UPI0039E21C0B
MSATSHPRLLGLLLLQSALIQAVAFVVRPTTSYEALALGLPNAALGAVGATFAVVPLLLAVPVGGWVDRVGERRLHLAGALLVVVSCVLLVLAPTSAGALILANGALGAGHLGCIVSQQTSVANSFTSVRLDSAFGYYTFAASLGQAAGPALIAVMGGGAVDPTTRPIFLAALILSGTLLGSTFAMPGVGRSEGDADSDGAPPAPRQRAVELLRVPGLTKAITTSAIVLAAVDLTVVYLPALGTERGMSSSLVGALLTVRALFSMASRVVLGPSARRLGRGRLLALSLVLSTVGMAALPVPMPVWLMVIVVAVLGLGLGVGQPLTMSWVTQQAPAGRRGQALSLRLAGNRLGQILLPSALGIAAAGTGAAGALVATAALLGSTLGIARSVRLDG